MAPRAPDWGKALRRLLSLFAQPWNVVRQREFKGLGRWNFAGMFTIGTFILILALFVGFLSGFHLSADSFLFGVGFYVLGWLGCIWLIGEGIREGVDLF